MSNKIDITYLVGGFLFFNKVLLGVILELYFEEFMNQNNINIIEFIEKDIESNLNYDIETIYQLWVNSDNIVRNRIKLFKIRGSNILKPFL